MGPLFFHGNGRIFVSDSEVCYCGWMTNVSLYLRLLAQVKPYRRVFALGIVGMVVVAATEPVLPALMKPLIEGTFVAKDPTVMRWIPLAIVALFALRGLATYLATYAMGWVGNRVVADLRNAMFAKLLALPAAYYDEQPAGTLVSRLTFDVTQVTAAATSV